MNTPDHHTPDDGRAFDARLRTALRELPHGAPPLDFARKIAAAAGQRDRRAERWWLLAPVLAFVPAALFALAGYGDAWTGSFAPVLRELGGAGAVHWIGAAAACLALSWVFARLRPVEPR